MSRDWSTAELFRACGDGDHSAWEEFVNRYHASVRVVALRICRRFGLQRELEQILHDVWGDLFERRTRIFLNFQPQWDGADLPYIKTVAANSAHDLCRRLARQGGMEQLTPHNLDAELTHSGGGAPDFTLEEALRLLRKSLNPGHAERDLTIFRLHYGFGFTSAEIAKLPGISLSESGVESVLVTCRKILRMVVKTG